MAKLGLNIGSGQRRFSDLAFTVDWRNVDCVSRPPDQVPDVICDAGKERLPFDDDTVDYVVLHHVLEHFGCGKGDAVIKESFRVLKEGGSLFVFVPDLRQLAKRWLAGEIDDFIFMVNCYGAYQGCDGDRHKWGYDQAGLEKYIGGIGQAGLTWLTVKPFNWRTIPGAAFARDWWVAAVECIK